MRAAVCVYISSRLGRRKEKKEKHLPNNLEEKKSFIHIDDG